MSHHITTIEGGMLVTNNERFYEIAKSIRAFGWIRDLKDRQKIASKYRTIDERFLFTNIGFNIRPTEIQGAFGIHQIKKLDRFLKIRKENAQYWNKRFKDLKDVFILPKETPGSKHAYFAYPLTIRKEAFFIRKEIVEFLKKRKIQTRPIMAGNMTEQPSMKLFDFRTYGKLKNSKLIMRNGLFFGNHQDIGDEQREYIADSIINFVNEKARR
jgi:CDP-6-deoxy-D-xylo-4-hexulose-3-dehydrase